MDAVEAKKLFQGAHAGGAVDLEGAEQDRDVRMEVDEGRAGEEAVGDGAGEHVVDEALEVGAELEDVELEEVAPARVELVVVADHEEDGNLGAPTIFFDSTKQTQIKPGGGDGLKVDKHGNVFATGPGGVLILSPQGKLLGRIMTGERIANVAWGNDGSVLYLTSDMYLCRIQTKTVGSGF